MSAKTRKALKRPGRPDFKSPLDKARAFEVNWPHVCSLFDATRRFDGMSFVYVIAEKDGGAVKIGVAKDPIARLRSMQTGNPRRLRIEYVLVGFRDTEKLLHEYWEPHAIMSEANKGKVGGAAGRDPGTEWFVPEIKEELFPIIETAVELQLEMIEAAEGNLSASETEKAIRRAHIDHDFVVTGRDQNWLLGAGGGYSVSRLSRIQYGQ